MKKLLLIGVLAYSLVACGQQDNCNRNYMEEIEVIKQEVETCESLQIVTKAVAKNNINVKGNLAAIKAINKDMLNRVEHILEYHKNDITEFEKQKLLSLKESFSESVDLFNKAGV